jgi:hypothetical protein
MFKLKTNNMFSKLFGDKKISGAGKILLAIAFTTFFLSCTAQQSQKRETGNFDKIRVSGSVNVFYTQSDTSSVIVKGKSTEIDRVQTSVENSVLVISNKGDFTEPVEVHVRHNNLQALDAAGATTFKTTNEISGDSIAVEMSGSANTKMMVRVKSLKCLQSGASSAVFRGSADKMDANISGASTLKAFELSTKNTVVITTGAANARVFANEKVVANAGGASDIKIKGNPTDVTSETSAAANISRVKEGQAGKQSKDTTVYNLKSTKIIVIDKDDEITISQPKKKRARHGAKQWRGISLGVNGYANSQGGINMLNPYQYMELDYARSWNLQVNPIELDFRIVQNYVRLVTGMGLDYHWYMFANNTNLNPDSSFTWGTIDSTKTYSYKKNSMRTIYIQVPLLLEFNTNNRTHKGFHMAVGIIGEYLIGSRLKQKLEYNDYEVKQKRKDPLNLNPFGAKAHVNIGYKYLTVYAEYNLTPLFQYGKGPELYPFTVGLRLIPFS